MYGNCLPYFVSISETLKDFKTYVVENAEAMSELEALKSEVQKFAGSFPMPGFEDKWESSVVEIYKLWVLCLVYHSVKFEQSQLVWFNSHEWRGGKRENECIIVWLVRNVYTENRKVSRIQFGLPIRRDNSLSSAFFCLYVKFLEDKHFISATDILTNWVWSQPLKDNYTLKYRSGFWTNVKDLFLA